MAILTFYNPQTLEQDGAGVLGVLNLDHAFIPVMTDGQINPHFHRYLSRSGVDSLQVTCLSGGARFRKENRPDKDGSPRYYWYAYKKIGGVLNKAYIGLGSQMTEKTIEAVVTKVNTPKSTVTQSDCVTKKTDAIAPANIELAGHKKSDRHLQPALPLATVSSNEADSKIKALEEANKHLHELLEYSRQTYMMLEHYEHELVAIKSVIAKYRGMTQGKNKKDNPRFAYLIDFLADIDKLS